MSPVTSGDLGRDALRMQAIRWKVIFVKISPKLRQTTPQVMTEASSRMQVPPKYNKVKEPKTATRPSAQTPDPKALDPILAALMGLCDSQLSILDKLAQMDKKCISIPAVIPVTKP